MIIICPSSRHSSTHRVADAESVKARFYCRLEQVSFFCSKGLENMFLHKGHRLEPLPTSWMHDVCWHF